MDYSTDCIDDSLKIYDGSSNHSARVANLCGINEYTGMTSTTNNLFFVFDSDNLVEYKGFQPVFALIGMKTGYIINIHKVLDSDIL